MSPLVSVIIPNFNHAAYLPERIESVINQSYQHFELFILDDLSTDKSQDIITQYAAKDTRIKAIFNDVNSGSTFKQWNKGVSITKGEYVWIAESDDVADTTFLEKMLPILQQHDDVGFVYCMSHKINEEGKIIGDAVPRDNPNIDPLRWQKDFLNDGRSECKNVMIFKNVIANASGVLFRKSAFLGAGGAVEGLKLCGDWLTYVKILSHSNVAFNSQYLNYFRVHSGTVRKKRSFNSFDAIWERYQVFRYISNTFDIDEINKSKVLIRLLTDFLREKKNFTLLLKSTERRKVVLKELWQLDKKITVITGVGRWVLKRILKRLSTWGKQTS